MRDQRTAGRFLRKAREGDDLLHAPFRVTAHRGHTVQTFQSLELALEAAEALGPDHYVIDRHGLQIWNPQRKLLRDEGQWLCTVNQNFAEWSGIARWTAS